MAAARVTVTGIGVAEADLARIAAHVGDRGRGRVLLAAGLDPEPVTAALAEAAPVGCVEYAPGDEAVVHRTVADLESWGLVLSVTTQTAYTVPVAGLICTGLVGRGWLGTGDDREGIEMAVHEAVANAVIHGNLGVTSNDRHDIDGLRAYQESITQGLADPARGRRRVTVMAVRDDGGLGIGVRDEGAGCASDQIRCRLGEEAYGRGFQIIGSQVREIDLFDDGRGLLMRFG